MTFEEACAVIQTERAYQDKDLIDKQWDHGGHVSVEATLLLAEEYLLKARSAWQTAPGNEPCLDMLRKVAGILVRCFEIHGCPERRPVIEALASNPQ